MTEQTLLLEIGTEELPPKSLLKLAEGFASGIRNGLDKMELEYVKINYYATPRRLAVMVERLSAIQTDKKLRKRGPAIKSAYNDIGEPTQAALGFAKSCGVKLSELEVVETEKGAWLTYLAKEKGEPTIKLIPEIAETALFRLPISKKMRWGAGSIKFVRPVHWVVAMFGTEIVNFSILNLKTSNQTFGHRFHHPHAILLESAESYLQQLEKTGKVIADFSRRKKIIKEAVDKIAKKIKGQALVDEDLLEEVTALVEWPVAFSGIFDEKYLNLPNEILIATMQKYQKYFPVIGKENNLLPCFIAVTNIESKSHDVIRLGNQRVISSRLNDAEFFWQRDNQITLATLSSKLADVVFHEKLGSLADKSTRISCLAIFIANLLKADSKLVARAAILSKCDLLTQMVSELPELQGIIGRYYAISNGENTEVATALCEQYMPRFSGDQIPQSKTGQIISIADKLDTLVGMFAIGKAPTGDKDPFALRRAALSILRIIIEGKLELDLQDCLGKAVENYNDELADKKLVSQIIDFMMDRLRIYYIDKGISVDIFEAVLMRKPTQPYDFHRRLNAVSEFRLSLKAESLISANKRIRNILKKEESLDNIQVNNDLLQEDAEQNLVDKLIFVEKKINPLLDKRDYKRTLSELSSLKDKIDIFFDDVMVMCEDKNIKNNRLALLRRISNLFLEIADLSKLKNLN